MKARLPDAPQRATRAKARKMDEPPAHRRGALTRVALVQQAKGMVGQRTVVIEGRRFRADCSGLVGGLYEYTGHPLRKSSKPTPRASASQSIYLAAVEHYEVFRRGRPRPGDLVFFANTYDANRDGKINDDVTHVGLVESVGRDGTVVMVHFSGGKVKRARFNLATPSVHRAEGQVVNDFLRRKRKSDGRKARYLAGELFVAYAAVLP